MKCDTGLLRAYLDDAVPAAERSAMPLTWRPAPAAALSWLGSGSKATRSPRG